MVRFVQQEIDDNIQVSIPEVVPILPLRNTVSFPFVLLPLAVGIPRSIKLVEKAYQGDRLIGLVLMKDASIEQPMPDQIHTVGTVALIHRVTKSDDGNLQVFIQGLERFRIVQWTKTKPYLQAQIELSPDTVEEDLELEALHRNLRQLARDVVALSPNLPEVTANFLDRINDPHYLVYIIAANSGMKSSQEQELLETDSLKEKLRMLISYLTREKEVLTIGKKIESDAQEELEKNQRDYFLRQQLKAIQKELGESDEQQATSNEYQTKIEAAQLPDEVEKEALRELQRLEKMPPYAAEHSVIRTYLDWLVDLPWNKVSEDRLDVEHARKILDQDHYDLQEVKDRIIEYLAVRKLIEDRNGTPKRKPKDMEIPIGVMGAILCFVGPPGVGKTSLGQSIARALNRKFTRMSLGGMRDEAEIRGHRRTYIGALPGRIIQAIKRAGTRNPVFMLDEIDKVGNDWRGDPSSALLEVLDPAQNHTFRDHYLDLDFDLSDVMFITTANLLETIPPPLRDRMEIINLDGYTEFEKLHIAQKFLVKRQIRANGLRAKEITFTKKALTKIIQDYTREAGVRNLERQIGTICRKTAVDIAAGSLIKLKVTPDIVLEYLKKEKFESEMSETIATPGISIGLAVTAVGGDILFVEATMIKGKKEFTLTGQLGDVMRESAQIAHSYVLSKCGELAISAKDLKETGVHVHVPVGSIPKDGPSAGLAMVTAIASMYCARPIRSKIGMTGEITLRGRVLPIGGVKMKVLAAHRAGLTTVILPKRNERDLDDVPEEIRKDMNFILVEQIDEVLSEVFDSQPPS